MKQYSEKFIKNIALLGHGGSGKSTLADAILYYGNATDRIGKNGDGTLIMDFDAEEKINSILSMHPVFLILQVEYMKLFPRQTVPLSQYRANQVLP